MTPGPVHIIGGGLAGSEAAWQLVQAGVPVVIHAFQKSESSAAISRLPSYVSVHQLSAANNASMLPAEAPLAAVMAYSCVRPTRCRKAGSRCRRRNSEIAQSTPPW